MLMDILHVLFLIVLIANIASSVYLLIAIHRVRQFKSGITAKGDFHPPVTILKPVCNLEVNLYENLSSFCRQDYAEYQVIFGVRDANDTAIPIIQRIIDENPQHDLELVIDGTIIGPNYKVSNLHNMYSVTKHSYLAIADSDMQVDKQYITNVIAPFADPDVGVVTCLGKALAVGGLESVLGSMSINGWFLPSVLVSAGMRDMNFCMGATMVVRHDVLEAIGGFKSLSAYLADDHMLGKLASAHDFKVVLSSYVVDNIVFEKSFSDLFRHELRWSRTVRMLEPLGHVFSFLMYGVPLALLAALLMGIIYDWNWLGGAIVVLAVGLRMGMHLTVSEKFALTGRDRSLWLVPLRDILSFLIWGASFMSRNISWRGTGFTVDADGLMVTAKEDQGHNQ